MADIIPIFHCFDENYVLPAAVAFDSMLHHADSGYEYDLIVAGSISQSSQVRLNEIVLRYPHAGLRFIGVPRDFSSLFRSTMTKGHYSEEMFFKFLVPDLLPNYGQAIVTDVDVVWLDDISLLWCETGSLGTDYLAGVGAIRPPTPNWLEGYLQCYEKDFSRHEIECLLTGAGLWVLNLELMREHNVPQRALDFAFSNAHRLRQPEQDVMNLVTAPRQKLLPPRMMVCSYFYDFYPGMKSTEEDLRYSASEMRDAYLRPVQLHYAGGHKPWNAPNVTASHHWFEALARTPFLEDWLSAAQRHFDASRSVRQAFELIAAETPGRVTGALRRRAKLRTRWNALVGYLRSRSPSSRRS